MATLVTATLPCEEFALSETVQTVPEVTFECEKIIETADGTVMPLVWARAPDFEAVETALDADTTVNNVELLSEFDDERLYRIEWVDQIQLLMEILVDNEATILDASSKKGMWSLRILYPTHDGPSETLAFCEDHGLSLTIVSIREMDTDPSGRYGLTDAQYKALTTAAERGYYEVPREADLDTLSEELGISHQALSERLRRGVNALITDTLLLDRLAHTTNDTPIANETTGE